MKGTKIRSWALTLGLAAGLIPCSVAFGAQTHNQGPGERQQPPSAQQQSPMGQQQANEKQPRTFRGKIIKTKTGKYALLTDPKGGKGYFLDDQKDAKKYEQKDVQIVATLDPQTSTLHVIKISPAS